ncbi:unnamed protein product [Caenorhabditis sp. 36 PRJEB53466]|nr:unnamed protein product [Caenorhabditis sp. 36 PRJEB53466]
MYGTVPTILYALFRSVSGRPTVEKFLLSLSCLSAVSELIRRVLFATKQFPVMSEISEVVPKIIAKVFSDVPEPFKEFNINIKLLENSRSFWSECYQVLVSANSEKYKENVVSPLFVKIPRISAINAALDAENAEENNEILRTLTAQEVQFYKDFARFEFASFPLPRFFYGESLENEEMAGLVCQDFSGIAGSIDFIPGFSESQVLQLLDALAGFHSKTVKISAEVPWEHYSNALYSQEYIRMLYNDSLQFEEMCPNELSGRIQDVKHIFDEDGVRNSNELNEQLGLPFVLCHNDLNASNVLWNKETGRIQAMIDFQHVAKGAVSFDIIRILCLGLSVKNRRDNTVRFLQHYYDSFKAHNSDTVPFSFNQLLLSYSAHFNFVNATTVFSLTYYYKMYTDTSLDLKDDVATKTKKAEEILSRAIGILDDVRSMERGI